MRMRSVLTVSVLHTLIRMEKVFACLLLAKDSAKQGLDQKLALYGQRKKPWTKHTMEGHQALQALKTLLFEVVPSLFLLGTALRDCHWDVKSRRTGQGPTILQNLKLLISFRSIIKKVTPCHGSTTGMGTPFTLSMLLGNSPQRTSFLFTEINL